MPKKIRNLNLGIQTYQILTNDDEVCIPRLSSILLAVLPMIIPAVELGTITLICFSRSAQILLSKSIAGLAVGSGFSIIFSVMKSITIRTESGGPETSKDQNYQKLETQK